MATNTSAAKQLGKRGGKSTAAKRTKEQRSEAAKIAAKERWKRHWSNINPDFRIFEYALGHLGFDARKDNAIQSEHRAKILEAAGYLVRDLENDKHGYLMYKPTEAGLKWWFTERVSYLKIENEEREINSLAKVFEGQGMGNTLNLYACYQAPAIYLALREGLLSFVSHRDYYPNARYMEEWVTVKITKKGYHYFLSLPRFVEVWL